MPRAPEAVQATVPILEREGLVTPLLLAREKSGRDPYLIVTIREIRGK
jgi:hypothetical protein